MKVPHLGYREVLRAFERAGWEIVSQRGSHIKLRKGKRTLILPAHNPLKRSTLAKIIKMSGMTLDDFLKHL